MQNYAQKLAHIFFYVYLCQLFVSYSVKSVAQIGVMGCLFNRDYAHICASVFGVDRRVRCMYVSLCSLHVFDFWFFIITNTK